MREPGRSEPPTRPGAEHPSADVLDELLRAFAVDTTDRRRLDEIDLTSPEVESLLAGTPLPAESDFGGQADQPEPAPGPDHVDNGEPESQVEDDGEGGEVLEGEPPRSTVLIALEDEPPDTVYLKGSLDVDASGDASGGTDGSSGRVFIDDRDPHGAADPISLEAATSASRIEPRMRARRIAVRRSKGRRRIKWVIIATVVIAVAVGTLAVLGSSLFAVDDVEVEGVVYTDGRALQAVIDDLVGTPTLRVDTDGAEEQLERIPWVDTARVTADFPHGVRIEIRERAPLAYFTGGDGRFRVIDRDGRVLDVLRNEPIEYLRLLAVDPPDLEAAQVAPPGYSAAAQLVGALTPTVRQRAVSVSVTADGGDLRLQLEPSIDVHFGAARELVDKLVRLETELDHRADQPITVIDVSTQDVTVE